MKVIFAVLAGLAVAQAGAVHAAGYGVGQESPSGAGVANAGGAAGAQDASTVWSNPAGMVRLGTEAVAGAHFLLPQIRYEDRGSVLFDGTPVSGGNGGNGAYAAAIPNLYFVWQQSPGLSFGLGINAPYGLVTDYKPDFVGRYSEVTTNLKTINFNPSVAVRLGGGWSVGGGVDIGYADAKLLQAVDFGSVCASSAFGAAACAAGFNLAPGKNDGAGEFTSTDFGAGFNIGFLYEFSPTTRVGAHYRSKIEYKFNGDSHFDVPANARAFLVAAGSPAGFTDGGAQTELTIPETASVSAYHELNARWAVMGDVTWTRWNRFDELRIDADNPQTPTNLLLTDWHNVFRLAAGATYRWSDALTLRGGLAYDESPIPTRNRGPGIPDSDRYVVATGLGWQATPSATIDVGYQHIFFREGPTARVSGTNSVMNGKFENDVDIVSLGLRWKF